MRRLPTNLLIGAITFAATFFATSNSMADKLDLSISRFITCDDPMHCYADIKSYERFMAEYAFGVSPKQMSGAGTLGYSGFYLGLEASLMPIPNTERWRSGTAQYGGLPPAMFLPAVHVRKGLPWSFEIGSSIHYLPNSELVALGGEVKWSLFEGFRKKLRGALPDIAARTSVMRILGQTDVDMTTISVDGSMSYPFGIGGMISLEPYAGFQYLWTLIRTEPLIYREEGSTPQYHLPQNGSYDMSALSGPNLTRMKLFGGLIIKYEVLTITLEVDWGLAQKWDTAVFDENSGYYTDDQPIDPDQLTTEVDHQVQFVAGIGMQF